MKDEARRKKLMDGIEKALLPEPPEVTDPKAYWMSMIGLATVLFFGLWIALHLNGDSPRQQHRAVLQSGLDQASNHPARAAGYQVPSSR